MEEYLIKYLRDPLNNTTVTVWMEGEIGTGVARRASVCAQSRSLFSTLRTVACQSSSAVGFSEAET